MKNAVDMEADSTDLTQKAQIYGIARPERIKFESSLRLLLVSCGYHLE
jgi:hypothetical protein